LKEVVKFNPPPGAKKQEPIVGSGDMLKVKAHQHHVVTPNNEQAASSVAKGAAAAIGFSRSPWERQWPGPPCQKVLYRTSFESQPDLEGR